MNRRTTAVALVACILAPLLVLADAPATLRLPAVLAFLTVVPGSALLAWSQPRQLAPELGAVVGISLAVATLVSQLMLVLGAWEPTGFFCGLALLCLPALALALRGEGRTWR